MDKDIAIFWQAGQAFLSGQNPYAVAGNFYPPATQLVFSLFALIPLPVWILVWRAFNIVALLLVVRKRAPGKWGWTWLAFAPAVLVFLTGQLDIAGLVLLCLVIDPPGPRGWRSVLAAALLTLKPQLAVAAVPWAVLYWLVHDRKLLAGWTAACLGLHVLPLVFNTAIYQQWIEVSQRVSGLYVVNAPGIFSLTTIGIPVLALAVPAVVLAALGLKLGRYGSLAAFFAAAPIGTWYNTVLLAGLVPAWLLIPVSWLGFGLAWLVQGAYPLALIPLAAVGWFIHQEYSRGRLFQAHLPDLLPARRPS